MTAQTTPHNIGTREEWLAAREQLLVHEKEHTRLGDELAQQRRDLPWVPVEKEYLFDTDDGEKALPELFDGRSQLLVYHFMFGPSYQAGCPVNSSIADKVDGVLPHLHSRDVTFLLVSQARLEKLQAYKRRMGSALPWVLDCTHRLQLRPRLLAHGRTRSPGCGADDEGKRASADRRAERPRVRHRCRRLHDGEPRLQRLLAKRRGRLPRVLDDVAWIGISHGLLPDPRPRTEARDEGEAWQLWIRRHDEYDNA